MTPLGRATRDQRWSFPFLQFGLISLRNHLLHTQQQYSLEMVFLELADAVLFNTSGTRQQDAQRIHVGIAKLLSHCWLHGDELPSKLHVSFDKAKQALEN